MKKIKDCIVQNCIPTPSSCVEWNGGDIPFLGICNGESLNRLILEVVKKLEDITEDNLADFDIDGLLDICNKKAPTEVTILSILNVVKDNQICMKDYLDSISASIAQITGESRINVNLKCFADYDSLGNSLSITRDTLDQLIINNLCAQKSDIETLEGKIINLQSQIDEILKQDKQVTELSFATCVDPVKRPSSSQVIKVAEAHCDLEEATGNSADIAQALSLIPATWAAKYATLPGWTPTPTNIAEAFGNALLVIGAQGAAIQNMLDTCCKVSCDDILIGFSAFVNEDGDGVILKFSSAAGTLIPAGFTDKGSKGVIKDINGNVEPFTLSITNNTEVEIPTTSLYMGGELTIELTPKMGDGVLVCEKSVIKTLKTAGCGVCEITAVGSEGASVVIVYESETIGFTAPEAPLS